MLKFKDLQEQGLTLSKQEAQAIHSQINEIAQRGSTENIVFPGTAKAEKAKTPETPKAPETPPTIPYTITQEDVDSNKFPAAEGAEPNKAGDEIEIPNPEYKAPAPKAEKPKAEKPKPGPKPKVGKAK